MLFKDKLKMLRLHSQLSQEELGEKVGVSTATISRIERGEQQPSFGLTAVLIQALNIPAELLLINEPPPEYKQSTVDEQLKRLDALYEKLKPEDQKLFNEMLCLITQGVAYGPEST